MWDWLFAFIDPLERLSIPYALVGSVVASIYGEPRATNDVDVVIQVKASDVPRLIAAYPADQFYLPPMEVMVAELERTEGGHLNIIALDVMAKADLYPLPAGQQTWFARRRSLAVAGRALWVAAPEVVILQKLLFFREGQSEKHLATFVAWWRCWVANWMYLGCRARSPGCTSPANGAWCQDQELLNPQP